MKITRNALKTGLCLLLACSMLLAAWLMPATAAEPAAKLTDETSRTSKEITLSNGTKTGVKHTKITLNGSTYGSNIDINLAEFSLSNTNLSVEVLNSGSQIVDSQTVVNASNSYNSSHSGQTVLAAINGDLWMTNVHSGSGVTTQVLKATRGVLMIDGEIWATQQLDQENLGATNDEKGTAAGQKTTFGVTKDNQPLVGALEIATSMKIKTPNGIRTLQADGINRLPATDSTILYNHRINDSNYALNDSYEVELEVTSGTTAFKNGGTVKAVVKAVYPAGSTTRPAITSNNIIVTARGNRITAIKNNFKVGYEVEFSTTVTDLYGRTDLWKNVNDAIGGHLQPLIDGKMAVSNGDTTRYPASLIGYRDDGSVVLMTATSATSGSRAALRFCDMYQCVKELGYNSVFLLDGGGSTTFVTLENGSYTVRNACSDGNARSVINSVAVVWNNTPVCQKQGSLDYITVSMDLSQIPGYYLDAGILTELVSTPMNCTIGYDTEQRAYALTTTKDTNDPYATLDLTSVGRMDADQYKYIVLKLKTDHPSSTPFVLYYSAGTNYGASEARKATFTVQPGMNEWKYYTVDMSGAANWTGKINDIRLDAFDSVHADKGTSMYIGAIVFCKTAQEAAQVQTGWAPAGSVTDYFEYARENDPNFEDPFAPPETEGSETDASNDDPVETPADTDPVQDPGDDNGDDENVTTAPVEDEVTEPEDTEPSGDDATPDDQPTETQRPMKSAGCGAVVGTAIPAMLIVAGAGAWVVRSKRKED